MVSLPLAAAGAVLAALLETSVFSELRPLGVKPDLVLVFAVISAMIIGVEDGLVWAFLGGLMLDLLQPERPVGATTLSLLICTGIAVLMGRFLPQARVLLPVLAIAALTWLYHLVGFGLIAAITGASSFPDPLASLLPVALSNAFLALVAAVIARRIWLRYGQHDRLEW